MQQIEHGIYIETAYPGVTVGAILQPMGTILVDAPLRAEDARTWLNTLYIRQMIGPGRFLSYATSPNARSQMRSSVCKKITWKH